MKHDRPPKGKLLFSFPMTCNSFRFSKISSNTISTFVDGRCQVRKGKTESVAGRVLC